LSGQSRIRVLVLWCFALLTLGGLLAACGSEEEPTAVRPPTRTPRPTFTPTPAVQAPSAPAMAGSPGEGQGATAATSTQPTPTPIPPEPTPTPTPEPQQPFAVVTNPLANLRNGPGTAFALVGTVERGAEFDIVGRNPAGDWWQICCVNGQTAWIAAFLVDAGGPLDGVPVPPDIPTPPPTPVPPTPTPAPPTPTPAPSYALQKGNYVEPRVNSNPIVTFFGLLCNQTCPGGGAVGGYRLVVETPIGRYEGPFLDYFQHGDPGLESEFIYNAKVEIPNGPPGPYKAYVVDSGGNVVSEPWEYTASDNVRTFLPRWILP